MIKNRRSKVLNKQVCGGERIGEFTAEARVVRKNPQDLAASSILGTISNPEQERGYASVGQERAN